MGFHRKQEEIRALEASMKLLRLFQPSLVWPQQGPHGGQIDERRQVE
jgi:hypothetical protein